MSLLQYRRFLILEYDSELVFVHEKDQIFFLSN